MVFPLMAEEKHYRKQMIIRNKINQQKQLTQNRYLEDCFTGCPKCKKQEKIEIAKPEENLLIDFCLNCGYKKEKQLEEKK